MANVAAKLKRLKVPAKIAREAIRLAYEVGGEVAFWQIIDSYSVQNEDAYDYRPWASEEERLRQTVGYYVEKHLEMEAEADR